MRAVLVVLVLTVEVTVPPPPPPLPLSKVELMGPNLMLENLTLLLGTLASTSAGTPEVVGQLPRSAPGWPALSTG